MGLYTNKGLYNQYDKNHKERDAEDYYATPTQEVENILLTLGHDFTNQSILEPCYGGGHMIDGIDRYLRDKNITPKKLMATDIKERGYQNHNWELSGGIDFLEDDYPIDKADVIIMNPPYSTLEPFLIRALEIAQNKLIVLCRTQALEGVGRFENIFIHNPPTDIYQYVDRIQCWRGGVKPTGSSAQAYAWLIWDKDNPTNCPRFHWIRRSE